MGVNVPKNLIYFIYFSGRLNDYHKLNLKKLNEYWPVFDGKKIVKIAVDGNYSVDPILELLPIDCNFILVKNNIYGEGLHFLNSLNQVKGGLTFYGHCKGVSRPPMEGLITWINHLYDANLKQIPDLSKKLFSGTCAKLLPCPPYVPQDFHYSGSFYWFNTDEVRIRVNELTPNKYLTERFPGMIAKKEDCNFIQPYSGKNLNFYLAKHKAT